MKLNNFNKLSGTELRTKNILNTFSSILIWIKEVTENHDYTFSDIKLEKSFKEYCEREGIYNYKDRTGINRFSMFISKLTAMGFITKNNGKCHLNVQLINENDLTNSFFKSILKYGNHSEFNNMIDFIYCKNEIKVLPLYFAMVTFEQKDSFYQLYNTFDKLKTKDNCINYLANISTKNILKDINKYKKSLNFKKPPKGINILKNIFLYKLNNKPIDRNFFENIDIGQIEKYTNHISRKNKTFSYYNFYNNLSLEQFILLIETNRLSALLSKEYFDIWFRWMKDFGFINAKTDIFVDSSFVEKKEGEYYIADQTKQLNEYPYNLEQVDEWLKQIDNLTLEEFKQVKNRIFKGKSQILNATRATIAEYLVNLKFAYLLNIEPKNFKKYSNTIVNNKLEPISHAPGGRADFSYFDQKEKYLINVETTLHNSYEKLHNNETTSNVNHILKNIDEYDCSKAILYNIILSEIDLETKELYENELQNYFNYCQKSYVSAGNVDITIDSVKSFKWLYSLKTMQE
ncbi:hypothetical protein ACNQ21_01720 [Mycoplasma sp. VS299A]|uniref:hypothetical protein n=1 Tax=unclassified Mycoplasma TaxID=2683645 RepID=UPI003AAEF589